VFVLKKKDEIVFGEGSGGLAKLFVNLWTRWLRIGKPSEVEAADSRSGEGAGKMDGAL
jgi:hypothetical protein